MSSGDQRLRQIKIKTGVLKRAFKEKDSYRQEAEKEQKDLDKLKALGGDEHRIKKLEEVLRETEMMIPDADKRTLAAYEELTRMLEDLTDDLKESVEYQAAKTLLSEIPSM